MWSIMASGRGLDMADIFDFLSFSVDKFSR